jgi:hypothetical protein
MSSRASCWLPCVMGLQEHCQLLPRSRFGVDVTCRRDACQEVREHRSPSGAVLMRDEGLRVDFRSDDVRERWELWLVNPGVCCALLLCFSGSGRQRPGLLIDLGSLFLYAERAGVFVGPLELSSTRTYPPALCERDQITQLAIRCGGKVVVFKVLELTGGACLLRTNQKQGHTMCEYPQRCTRSGMSCQFRTVNACADEKGSDSLSNFNNQSACHACGSSHCYLQRRCSVPPSTTPLIASSIPGPCRLRLRSSTPPSYG